MKAQPTANARHSHTAQAGQHHSDACVAVTFGESFVSQRLQGAPARYTFSACRGMRRLALKDLETGYSYFGARYYESGLSIWLSVDPLADKYPSLSSYVYCANNPVILVDPDGREVFDFDDIIIEGANHSNVTVTTDLVDMTASVAPLGIDFKGNYQLEETEVLIAVLDLVGRVDPTGVADGVNASLQLKEVEWVSVLISLAGVIPVVGDAAKIAKIKGTVQVIENAIQATKVGKFKLINQLNAVVKIGQATKGIVRFDGKTTSVNTKFDEVHFTDGSSLKRNGE